MANDTTGRPSRPGTAVHEKGRQRVEEILNAATLVLIEDGYASFTMRRIAEKADVRLSNLQYYFKIKEDLLNALLKRTFDNYTIALEEVARTHKGSPKSRFMMTIDYLLKDQEDQASCAIFWELWALAGRDRSVAAIMNAYYTAYLEQVTDAIRGVSPDMPKRRAQRHAGAIVALIEGASLLRGFGKPRRTSLAGYEQTIRDICEGLAQSV